MTVLLILVLLLLARDSDAILLNASEFADLLQLAIDFRLVDDVVTTQEQYLAFRTNGLHELPNCPFASSLFECEGVEGEVTSLTLDLGHLRLPNNAQWLYNNWNFNGGSRFRKLEIRNFYGRFGFETILNYYLFETSRAVRSLVVHNSTFTVNNVVNDASEIRFLFDVTEISLTNVSFPQIQLNSTPTALPKACSFVNVLFVCPVPSWIWRCFNGSTVEPPCWASVQPVVQLPGGVLATSLMKVFNPDMLAEPPYELSVEGTVVSCDPPPLNAANCMIRDPIYVPPSGTRGSITVRVPLLGRGISVTVTDLAASNLTTLLEVFDWETGQFVVAVNRTAPRDSLSTRSVDVISIPRVLTNTVRVTFEHILPSDSIYSIFLRRAFAAVNLTGFVPWRPECPAAVTLNERRSLDETIADSYCVNRVCQFDCPDADAARVGNFSFGAAVDAAFVAIEGGSGWPQGELVMQTSDETNVYRLNLTNVTQVALSGVVDARRVRLIGTAPGASADTTIVRLPGKFVKRLRHNLLGSKLVATDWRAVGSLPPPFASTNASVAVVNGTMFVYSVANNTVFRASAGGDWVDLRPSLSDLFVNLSDVPHGVVRRMVSVSDRFLIVLGANVNERYDGGRMRDWIARRVTASPIDVLDTVTDRWSYGLLQHGIESSTVDIDVVSLDTTRFAVVNRQRTVAVEVTWQPFPFALVECSVNDNCNTCLTNFGNIADCRWCNTGRCIDRLAICDDGSSTIDVAMCPVRATTIFNNSSNSSLITTSNGGESTADMSSSAGGSVASASSTSMMMLVADDPLIGLYIAIGVVLFLIAVGAISFLLWRRSRAHPAVSTEVPLRDETAKSEPTFDPTARYGNLNDVGDDIYDVGNFPQAAEQQQQ